MKIYSVVQDDYEAPIVHCSFAKEGDAVIAKRVLKILWNAYKQEHDAIGEDEDAIVRWDKERFSISALDEFTIIQETVYTSIEEWTGES